MNDPIPVGFAIVRAIHFIACLLWLAAWGFDRLIIANAEPEIERHWRGILRGLLWLAVPLAFASGLVWFGEVVIVMSDLPIRRALAPSVLSLVWSQTQFGKVWQARCWIGIVGTATGILASCLAQKPMRTVMAWLAFVSVAIVAAALALAGHGQYGDYPRSHLAADFAHLVVSGLWPTGLLPLLILLGNLRKNKTTQRSAPVWLHRFSRMSFACVLLLLLTGIVNSWLMLGTWSALWSTRYGRVLLVKIGAFSIMVGLGAWNRWLVRSSDPSEAQYQTLRRNLLIENALGILVLGAVGLLGLLSPPMPDCPM